MELEGQSCSSSWTNCEDCSSTGDYCGTPSGARGESTPPSTDCAVSNCAVVCGMESCPATSTAAAGTVTGTGTAPAGFPQDACTTNCAAQPTTCGAAEQMMAHFGCANACSNRFKNNVRKYLECGDTTAQPTTTGTGTGTGTGTDTGTTAGSSVQCTSQCAPRVRGRRGLRL